MRLLALEIKRVLKTKRTWILIVAAVLLAVFMAYIPITFVTVQKTDESGNYVEITGKDAINYYKSNMVQGVVTPEILRDAVRRYQEVYKTYDSVYGDNIPSEVYYEKLSAYQPYIRGIKEALADRNNGMSPVIADISIDKVGEYYDLLESRLASVIDMEQTGHPAAKEVALSKFAKVQRPYEYYYGAPSDSMEYETLFIFLITILCAVIVAPIFSTEYQTGADDIIRCTKNGKRKLAIIKVASACLIVGMLYLLCGITWIVVTNSLFGWEGTKTSIQLSFSVTTLLPYNVGQLQWANLLGGFLLFLSAICFTLLLSSLAKSNVSALALALLFVLLPFLVYTVLPGQLGDWLQALLPGAGIGLGNSLLYAMTNFDFLHLGSASFWNTDVMLVLALVKIPLFIMFTIVVYDRKRIR